MKERTSKRRHRRNAAHCKKTRHRRLSAGLQRLDDRRLLMADFTLQLLHASDLEGGVEAIGNAPGFAALADTFQQDAGGDADATVTISAGDNYIPGPFFSASGDRSVFRDGGIFNDTYNTLFGTSDYNALREGSGRVDISIMNVIGFDASAIGNHEFDQGSDAFESIIEEEVRDPFGPINDRWVGSQFPYLSANLDFSGDGDLGDLFTTELLSSDSFAFGPAESAANNTSIPKIAPFTVIDAGGQSIGVIGATTQLLETISSPSGTVGTAGSSNDMQSLADILNPQIATLKLGLNGEVGGGDDIDKIILTSHLQQIALEEQLIQLLDGVDIVIAGGSDTILADGNDALRPEDVDPANPPRNYPILTTNREGNPAAIVSTSGEYSYLGRLVVDFDASGNLITSSIDPAVSGAYATTESVVTAVTGEADLTSAIAASAKATEVQKLTDAVSGVVTAKDSTVFGESSVFIEGRREFVRTQETNMGNLTADANLAAAQSIDPSVVVSLKNGGGIRAEIGVVDGTTGDLGPTEANPASEKKAGEISQLDIENTLRFNNGLTALTVTVEELKHILEHAVAATGPGSTPGQFPQVGGLSFSFDPNGTPITFNSESDINLGASIVAQEGSRIQNVALIDADGNTVDVLIQDGVPVTPGLTVRLVTLDFLVGGGGLFGGDSYPFRAFGEDFVDLKNNPSLADGVASFADKGSEQDALAEYLAAQFPVGGPAFDSAEVGPQLDRRIQDVTKRADTVVPVSGTLVVTSSDDFGEGSFRNAVQIASDNPGVRKIIVAPSVELIELESSVDYFGQQDLKIIGNDVIIRAGDEFSGPGVLIASGGADLVIKDLTVDGDFDEGETPANGIFVPVPADASGKLEIVLDSVTVVNSGLFGVHIDDQAPEPGDTENLAGFDSDATIVLRMKRTEVVNNGIGALDYDGVRVDDGGKGGIVAHIDRTHIDANGGDGLELDERGDGDVSMRVRRSTFDSNGFFDEEDLDDGLDIDEAGEGSIHATLTDVTLIGNFDEGLDLDEEDGGGVWLTLRSVEASENLDEGIKVSEEDGGGIHATMTRVIADGNGDDGIELEEEDAGGIFSLLLDVSTALNGDTGIQIAEAGDGGLLSFLNDVESSDNTGNGLELTEGGGGSLVATVIDSVFSDNGEFGVLAEQEEGGLGLLALKKAKLSGNELGDLEVSGVRVLGKRR